MRLFTRRGHDWTERYWASSRQAPRQSFTLDGEAVVEAAEPRGAMSSAARVLVVRKAFTASEPLGRQSTGVDIVRIRSGRELILTRGIGRRWRLRC
jgi:hypothetical protein